MRIRFARRPLGGSVVILIARCRIAMGKAGLGDDDSHSRNDSCGRRFSKPSIILSSVGSHDVMRWQFARKTQLPSFRPSSIRRVAMGAWPWPSATVWNLLSMPRSVASLRSMSVGSTPADSTKMSGERGVESATVSARSSTGGSTNLRPSALAT